MLADPYKLYTPEKRGGFRFFNSAGTPNRYVGVELEIAQIDVSGIQPMNLLAKKWDFSIHGDGSLPETGFEINLAPAKGEAFIAQVNEVCKVLKTHNAKVSKEC